MLLIEPWSNPNRVKLAYCLMQVDLVFLEELCYLLFSQAGGALLSHLLSKLYECTSFIITTNPTFAEWPNTFGDAKMITVLLDRLTYHCHIIETSNNSYRFRQSTQQAKVRIRLGEHAKRSGEKETTDEKQEDDHILNKITKQMTKSIYVYLLRLHTFNCRKIPKQA